MRIAQLSRKLNISQTEITGFFKRRKISGYVGGNSKLSEEHLRLIVEYFRPELTGEFFKDDTEPDETKLPSNTEHDVQIQQDISNQQEKGEEINSSDSIVKEKSKISSVVEPTETFRADQDTETKEVEIIRAPKIKLDGLKVVGKIELPEKPKKNKENPSEENIHQDAEDPPKKKVTETKTKEKQRQRKDRSPQKYKKGRYRKPKREETYEEKLKRLEREKIRRQKAREKQLREKKRQHYLKVLQAKQASAEAKPKKPKKRKDTAVEEIVAPRKKIYKNPLRRFWAWLNGEFDEY